MSAGQRDPAGRAVPGTPDARAGAPGIDAYVREFQPGNVLPDSEIGTGARRYVEALRDHLAYLHDSGASGEAVNLAHSDGVDRLVRRLAQRADARHFAEGGEGDGSAAVLAIGGYARQEMAVGSDVDLLVLQEGEGGLGEAMAQRIQYPLWDAGLELGFSVRTLEQTIALGREDDSACTALLWTRFLGGDARLFHEFTSAVRERLIPDVAAFIEHRRAVWAERHAKFGDSLYLLQPNVKESAGALRDYHSAGWAARALDPIVQGRQDFLHAGLLTESEMEQYEAALQFLWRVRNHLHLRMGRKVDQLSYESQELVAEELGYHGRDGELPVEHFMREYYRHARAIQTFSEIVLEQCEARAKPPVPRPRPQMVEDGFRVVGDHLEIPHANHLRERPLRVLLAFAVAQDHDVPLSRTAQRIVRENLALLDGLREDPEAAGLLMRILSSENRVMRTLMAMNEIGVLGRYLPEWDHVVCRWQHVAYHTYTVDVHSIFLVEQLRRLWRGKYEEELPALTALVRETPDLPVLYLGCLLHDIGKGYDGDHCEKGAEIAVPLLQRLGLSEERIERAVFIVRQHLLMSHVAQRRDLGDPKVIVDFARAVGDREHLRELYLATYADMRASSDAGFSDWRAGLMAELFERTSEYLESGEDDPQRAAEQIEARVAMRREQAARELVEQGVDAAEVEAYFEMMPRRYFASHTPRQIARHAALMISLGREDLFAMSVREMRGDFTEVIIATRDVHGLYGDVAGCLTAAGINILGSHVYTTRTDLALEIYRVNTPAGGEEEKAHTWQRLEQLLRAVLGGETTVAQVFARQGRRIGTRRGPRPTPPSVALRNDVSDFYTVIDVTADDRLGLLADLTRTIADHGLEIYVSKAATVLDQVADTFYVKAADQRKLTDPARMEALTEALLVAAGPPAEETDGA